MHVCFSFLNYFKKQLLNSMYIRYYVYKILYIQDTEIYLQKKTVQSRRVFAKLYWAEEMTIGSTIIMIATYYSVCNLMDVMYIKIQKKKRKGNKPIQQSFYMPLEVSQYKHEADSDTFRHIQ